MSFITGDPFEFEYRLKGADGSLPLAFRTRCFPLKGKDGKILRWFGTNTDISRKREAEEEKRLLNDQPGKACRGTLTGTCCSKEKLQAVLDAATHVSIIAADTEGVITVFNHGAEQMLGYMSDEMVGKQSPTVIHLASEVVARGQELTEELGKPVQGFDVFAEKARNGQHEEREWTYVRKDGKTLTVNLVVTASYDTNGAIVGFLGVAMDVTARKEAEDTLRDQ